MDYALKQAENALRLVLVSMPHLAGLAASVQVQTDDRVDTAGVFASGRLLLNPIWFGELTLPEATFVMAHELMHLVFRTHERGVGTNAQIVNIAHDLIINRALEKDLGMKTPVGGLTFKTVLPKAEWPAFEEATDGSSLESIVSFLRKNLRGDNFDKAMEKTSWKTTPPEYENNDNPFADQLRDLFSEKPAPVLKIQNDVLSSAEEHRLFPNETKETLEKRAQHIEKIVWESLATQQIEEAIANVYTKRDPGNVGGTNQYSFETLRTHHAPPWEWAMQQWLEETTPPVRSYARTSRRGSDFGDIVRPGRLANPAFTLNIVLDTSGSMTGVLPRALGIIASFCEGMNIESIRIVQSDTQVTADERVTPADLKSYVIQGMGGSDMTEAMQMLAQDDTVERVIVLTDGYISYPDAPMPYEVLWTLIDDDDQFATSFTPGYGNVIMVRNNI